MSERTRIVIALIAAVLIGLVEALLASWRYQAANPTMSASDWWLMLIGIWILASAFNYLFIRWWRMRRNDHDS